MKTFLSMLLLSVALASSAQTYAPVYRAVTPPDVTGESALYYLDNNGNDSSGNGYNLTLTASPSFVTSLNGSTANGALSFNGSSQYASQTAAATIVNPSSTDFSISMWIKVNTFDGTVTTQRNIAHNIDGNNVFQGFLGDGDAGTTNAFCFDVYYGGTEVEAETYAAATPLTTGTVYHVTYTWNHTTHAIQIYVGAVLQPTTSVLGLGKGTADNKLYLAARASGNSFANVIEDDVRIYPFILTGAQVSNLDARGAQQ